MDESGFVRTSIQWQENQITPRDYFAAKALAFFAADEAHSQLFQAIEARGKSEGEGESEEDGRILFAKVIAKRCYMIADAMLEERRKQPEKPF